MFYLYCSIHIRLTIHLLIMTCLRGLGICGKISAIIIREISFVTHCLILAYQTPLKRGLLLKAPYSSKIDILLSKKDSIN